MLYHLFRSLDLDDIFVLHNSILATNWKSTYKDCLAYHNNHLIDVLKVYQKELNDNLDKKSLENQINIKDIKHEKLLNMQKLHHDRF